VSIKIRMCCKLKPLAKFSPNQDNIKSLIFLKKSIILGSIGNSQSENVLVLLYIRSLQR